MEGAGRKNKDIPLIGRGEVEEANRAKLPGYELLVKGALLRFLSLLIAFSRYSFRKATKLCPVICRNQRMKWLELKEQTPAASATRSPSA